MIIDIEIGAVIIRGPDALLRTIDDMSLTPKQARAAAIGLDADGNAVVAEALRRAADLAESGVRT
ncbi:MULTISPECIES: hypothetical protein [Mycolicibacter]|uniref:Uncharacterized protein n=2 Tax=Mycolicibacter TaxID=1073531 RepID=A0ABU5XL75_9MYCO|nr:MULTISPECIES: hypothetical protein [unclassified Mycolicibacter]MEB3023035.1 hypothetical protein [Mycolicibacter sp. MYC098]MEB3033545.1 hypothetical protein [Mycolicibacter sp. MYC340]